MQKTLLLLILCTLCLCAYAHTSDTGFSAELRFEDFSAYVAEGANVRFSGTLQANAPLARVHVMCEDLYRLKNHGEYLWESNGEEQVTSLSLYSMRKALFSRQNPGDYLLRFTVESTSGAVVQLCQRVYIAGEKGTPACLNSECTIDVEMKHTAYLYDGRIPTRWEAPSAGGAIEITFPSDKTVCALAVSYLTVPDEGTLRIYDAQNTLMEESPLVDASFTPRTALYPIPPHARSVQLSVSGRGAISELYVLEDGRIPVCIQDWQKPAEKWDLMLISTHQDDEHIFFGATIPLYASTDRDVGIVYMADCGEDRYLEALNGLWSAGMRKYPVFLGMRDGIRKSLGAAYSYWGGKEAVVAALVEQIRTYQPEVILTHDLGGEYDNFQHMATARCVIEAVTAAADPAYLLDEGAPNAPWQAKKLYLHLYDSEAVVDFDWNAQMPGYDGMSGFDVSKMAYSYHRSQQKLVSYNLSRKADNSLFGLYLSTVGPDTGKNSLFENIDDASVATATP